MQMISCELLALPALTCTLLGASYSTEPCRPPLPSEIVARKLFKLPKFSASLVTSWSGPGPALEPPSEPEQATRKAAKTQLSPRSAAIRPARLRLDRSLDVDRLVDVGERNRHGLLT